jgi:hypothetical protein
MYVFPGGSPFAWVRLRALRLVESVENTLLEAQRGAAASPSPSSHTLNSNSHD